MTKTDLEGLRVLITGGTSGLGRALVGELRRRGARVAFVARSREAVERTSREWPDVLGVVADVSKKDDTHPIAIQALGVLGGLDVLVNNASSLGPAPLVPLADTECEDLGARPRHQRGRSVSPDEGPAGIARRVCPGGSPPAGGERVERRCGEPVPELGGLWREQGGPPSSQPHLERRAARRRHSRSCPLTRAIWTRRCTPLPCPMRTARR